MRVINTVTYSIFTVVIACSPHLFAGTIPGGTLNPRMIPKYVRPLVVPPQMPATGLAGSYNIEVVPHNQQILPLLDNDGKPLNATPVWTYGAVGAPATRNYPAFTIEATKDVNTQIVWRNNLVDANGAFLPHLLPVDRSLHWANPELLPCDNGETRTDCRPASANGLILQQPYTGPVPLITHVHGAHSGPESDGYPEAWYLPAAKNIPAGYATTGRLANQFGPDNTVGGAATFNYPNDQNSTTLWYHDHTLGMTRLNVYAGPAGFYLLRETGGGETGLVSGSLPGPRPGLDANPVNHLAFREIPIAIQDRSFNVDPAGNTSLFYPNNRAFFEGTTTGQLQIPFAGDPVQPSDIAAIWNPEFFGNVMVVNGVSWPYLSVEPERYRFRLLNGCNSRVLNLSLVALNKKGNVLGEVPFYQIGAEQGLLPKVVRILTGQAVQLPGDGTEPPQPAVAPAAGTVPALLMGLAERADVIVDFSQLPAGTAKVRMLNSAPDAPFGGFPDIPADAQTTGQVMEFVLAANNPGTVDNSAVPKDLVLAPLPDPVVPAVTRNLALLEMESSYVCVRVNPAGKVQYIDLLGVMFDPMDPNNACALAGGVPFAPQSAMLGSVMVDDMGMGMGMHQMWSDPIQQTPVLDTTENWEIWNFTMDAHPIHLHLVQYRVLGRELFTPDPAVMNQGMRSNVITPPEAWETGFKDTALMYPGQITHIQARFDTAGLYVWHCHIVEHEDNEMMVPYCVDDPAADQTGDSVKSCGPQAPPGI
jgi:FtsP/CotA-like multicopper oxidase with cupredoxin domain